MRRPTGVTLLSLSLLAYGTTAAVAVLALIYRPGFQSNLLGHSLTQVIPQGSSAAEVFEIVGAISAIYSLVVGTGLWLLWPWSRWVLLLGTGIPLGRVCVQAATMFVGNRREFEMVYGATFWIWVGIYGLIAWYLMRSDVQGAFDNPSEYFDPKFNRSNREGFRSEWRSTASGE